jgi:hypothetical protein
MARGVEQGAGGRKGEDECHHCPLRARDVEKEQREGEFFITTSRPQGTMVTMPPVGQLFRPERVGR